MKKVVVLGAGLVGKPIAVEMKKLGYEVSVLDKNPCSLDAIRQNGINCINFDLNEVNGFEELLKPFDLVISAVPGFLGFQTVSNTIKAKKNVVDIAFFPEDPEPLEELAKENNITAIIDCGVAPGMSNLLASYGASKLDKAEDLKIFVGGLPKERVQPFEYKAGFSPIDVIEEYTRPARVVVDNQLVVKQPLSEIEAVDFKGIGTLEAFNSDGLRSLTNNLKIRNMSEKTLRYPGHALKIQFLHDIGLLSSKEIKIGSQYIAPIDVTANLLISHWELKPADRDLAVMKIMIAGEKDGKKVKIEFSLYDEYDENAKIHSMARTTGFTATTISDMFLKGKINHKGLIFPEFLGKDENLVNEVFKGLVRNNINYIESKFNLE